MFSPQRKSNRENLDRFIPNRAALDFDYAKFMVAGGGGANHVANTPYRKMLDEAFNMNRPSIFTYKNKPATPIEAIPKRLLLSPPPPKSATPRRHIPLSPHKVLLATDIVDDFFLNLLDWSVDNVVAIALGNSVYLWYASDNSVLELVVVDEADGPVTSVCWVPDGHHPAVGLNSSRVELWDSRSVQRLRTLSGGHRKRVGSLAWNKNILTTGSKDGKIISSDVRVRNPVVVETYRGHKAEVCGLKWSPSGRYLASGGNDSAVFLWDCRSTNSSNSQRRWLHRLEDHTAAVKALAWCPFQESLLASGGGGTDCCIKFWNVETGLCLNSVDTGSQVCALLWNKNKRELLSSHGFRKNGLVLWKYPSMEQMAELAGHTSRVLFMTQSPNGSTVATAAADETLRFWNVFGVPPMPFADKCFIR